MDFHFSEQSNLLFSVHQHKVLLCFGIVCGLSSLLTKLNTWACVWVTEIPITEGSIKEGCFTTRFLNSSPLMQPCKIRYTHTSATNEQIWVLLKVLFLSLRLLWNLKNNELFKRVQLWHINTLKSLFYLTKRGVFLPKGKQTFPHKISPCVSCFFSVVCLTVNLATANERETGMMVKSACSIQANFYSHMLCYRLRITSHGGVKAHCHCTISECFNSARYEVKVPCLCHPQCSFM